ncbi:MAG: hypothetical protein KME17_20210 [Cyanosarcina radialis HA8281-LM2]|jgi:hypothetical protein|nr:hypothetical protein [Cyanosarcina radialis HA8281-LM2]
MESQSSVTLTAPAPIVAREICQQGGLRLYSCGFNRQAKETQHLSQGLSHG